MTTGNTTDTLPRLIYGTTVDADVWEDLLRPVSHLTELLAENETNPIAGMIDGAANIDTVLGHIEQATKVHRQNADLQGGRPVS
ncbi:hypothetical protein EU803_15200 [Loktanella sp. IMCC34160]|uniref:hypothetical protein n=1 Tax=Loktanella sp. IMCC34160 TaxID=2510646 RepID=UPI00101C721F|nr:hypothetical protein [Loktanella sp. IMCC34160]RYG89963.1 hypothetical protein EU803_15200 [Loktanella sp. IMCC34160]